MKQSILILGMAMCMVHCHAQNINRNNLRNSLDDFRQAVRADFENFRKKAMEDFIEFARDPWKEFKGKAPVPKPKEEPTPPVVLPEDDKDKELEDKPVVIEEVVPPVVVPPQPEPVEPIEEVPLVEEKITKFTFFGTPLSVRFDIANKVSLKGLSENSVSDALEKYTQEAYDNMILDCLNIRKELSLSDWAYLQMLKALAYEIHGGNNNDAALMLGYIYMQSGYKMRYGMDASKLYMLYASKHYIYDIGSYEIDNERYYGIEKLPSRMYICNVAFPKEQSLSLYINQNPKLASKAGKEKKIQSERYKNVDVTVKVNQNLIEFYNTYPTSIINDNVMTRWAMYANTPFAEDLKKDLYPKLKSFVVGKSQAEAVNIILNWVQTGLEYEYDDKVWGGDRAFFAEESLNYPYCDCEDRSILFTRLVRDLLGLKCILVFYPGHLAAAVNFTESIKGDYIMLDNNKYVITDPTYIGAPIGMTMPSMDNASAKVILLD